MKYISFAKGVIGALALSMTIYVSAEEGDGAFDDLQGITTERSGIDDIETKKLSDQAFKSLVEEMYPESANPEMIQAIKELEQKRINALYANKEPRVLSEIINVSTRPGAKTVEVQLAPLHTSIFTILDSTGEPWPVLQADIGNGSAFKGSKIANSQYNNAVQVTPQYEVGSTNLLLTMEGNPIPIHIKLKANMDKYYPVPVLMLDREGPKAKVMPVATVGAVKSESMMKDLVLGIAPDHFRKLNSSDPQVEAWKDGQDLYLRTKYTPSSPAARSMTHGYGGYGAYRMNHMPIIYMTDNERGFERRIVFTEDAR